MGLSPLFVMLKAEIPYFLPVAEPVEARSRRSPARLLSLSKHAPPAHRVLCECG